MADVEHIIDLVEDRYGGDVRELLYELHGELGDEFLLAVAEGLGINTVPYDEDADEDLYG